ncbi:MAG: ABC transporter substrate-binding protein [Chloroflexota bacterium]
MYKKQIGLFLSVCLLLTAVTGVVAQNSSTLTIALPNDPTSLYLPRGADVTARNAALPLYDSLVYIDNDGVVQPLLATDWTLSDNDLEWTFNLREGVTFHNGEAFNADAVVKTWELGLDETNDWVQDFSIVEAIDVVDDFTIIVKTAEPAPFLLNRMDQRWGIVPPAYADEVGVDGLGTAPVGTGPFKFVERRTGDRIVYEANTQYWAEGQPGVENLVFRIIPDATTRLAAVQTGEIDIAPRLDADLAATLEGLNNVSVLAYPADRVYYVGFKNVGPGEGAPTEDILVRQALNYAVDRPGIVQGLFGGQAVLISGFLIESNLGFNADIEPYPYDPDRALELLAEAGYPDGEGLSLSMGCPTDAYLNINEVCLAIQRDLSSIGIDIALEFETSGSYWSEPQYGSVGLMYVDSWSAPDAPEPMNRLGGALTQGNYYNTWEDDTITDFLSQLLTTMEASDRAGLYTDLHTYMYENPPFIYLYAANSFEGVASRVEGYAPNGAELYRVNTITISE